MIWRVLKKIVEFCFRSWLLHLLDFYIRLTSNSFLKELIFWKKCFHTFCEIFTSLANFLKKLTDVIIDRQLTDLSRFSQPYQWVSASASRSPVLPRYLSILQNFKRICSFQYFFGRSCYYYDVSHINIQRSNPMIVVFCYFF